MEVCTKLQDGPSKSSTRSILRELLTLPISISMSLKNANYVSSFLSNSERAFRMLCIR
jgi:hypothetical protein